MGEELLPCPRCAQHAFVHFSDPGYQVWCSTDCCLKLPPRSTEAEAIAAWNTRASTPPVGETSALAEELRQCKAGRQHFKNFDSRKLSVDYLVPEDLFNRILAALRKPAEPVGDEVERRRPSQSDTPSRDAVERDPNAPPELYGAVGMALFRADMAGMNAPDSIAEIGNAAFTALSSTPERGWQPIETAPRDKTHVALLRVHPGGSVTYGHGYYMPMEGWMCWKSSPSGPPTHWCSLPDPFGFDGSPRIATATLTKGSTDGE